MGERKSGRRALAAAAVLVAAGGAAADDAAGNFAIEGAGTQDCARFLAAWEAGSGDLALYGGWIDGYVTGLNQRLPETYDLTPWQTTETMLALTVTACRQMGEEARFADAVAALLRELFPQRLAAISDLEGAQAGEAGVALYRETLRAAQRRLREEGHDPGPEDGLFSAATIGAVEAFQRARGIEVTGLPDQRTLFELFLKPRPPAQ